MMFFSSSYDEIFAGELNYMSMFNHNEEMIMNSHNNQMFASSPEYFFALSPLSSTDQNHHLLHHEEELHPFPGLTTNTTPEELINGNRTDYSLSKSAGDAGTQLSVVGRGTHQVMTSAAKVNSNVGSSPAGGLQIRGSKVGKKNRHSKIVTAQGPRDRRMRLSLEVARRFFDLQDMLGYDKASKTVAWLLANSRPAIKILAKSSAAAKAASDREFTSWAVEHHISTGRADRPIISTISGVAPYDQCLHQIRNKRPPTVSRPRKNKAMTRTVHMRKSAAQAREWRAMARARARERTWKKLCLRSKNTEEQSSSPFEAESGGSPSGEPTNYQLSPAAGGIGADNKGRLTGPPIFTAAPSNSLSCGSNSCISSHLQCHGIPMAEHNMQQNWEASGDLLHVPASIGLHGDEGKLYICPLSGHFRPFSPPS